MFDLMKFFGFKKEKTLSGIILFCFYIAMQLISFISIIVLYGFSTSALFNLIFYISISLLCINGFRLDNTRLVEVGASILFIYAGVNGFISLGSISNSGGTLQNLYSIFNAFLNLSSAIAFSLYISIWIRRNDYLAKIEKYFLFASSLFAFAVFIIELLLCIQMASQYSDVAKNIFLEAFTYTPPIFLYLAISYALYFIDR